MNHLNKLYHITARNRKNVSSSTKLLDYTYFDLFYAKVYKACWNYGLRQNIDTVYLLSAFYSVCQSSTVCYDVNGIELAGFIA